MIKTAIWVFAGLLLGLIIHLSLILALPHIIPNNVWNQFAKIGDAGQLVIIEKVKPLKPNSLRLDPDLIYAVCRYDLSIGPGILSGKMPKDFWSIGVFNKTGTAIYSTTNRSGGDQSLDLGIFNSAQTRLLAEQKIKLQKDLLIVKSPQNEIFVVIRLAPPHPSMWTRYKKILEEINCGHIGES
jgi:uncharacterized membrane protein